MRIGISISESGNESSLKSVFSSVGFAGDEDDDDDSLRLQEQKINNPRYKDQ